MKTARTDIFCPRRVARFTRLLCVAALLAVISLPPGAGHAQDFNKGLEAYKRKQFDIARAEFLPLAQAGNAQAQYNLGQIHLQQSETGEAIRYLKMAASQGMRSAQYNLGVIYARGDGVAKNLEEAMEWYALAGANGHPTAQFNLGVFYRDGLGTATNGPKAVEWLTKSAKNGDVLAQINLARIYALGKAVPKDLVRSYMWLEITGPRPDRRRNPYNRHDSARYAEIVGSAVAAKKLLEEQMSHRDIERARKQAGDWIAAFGTTRN